MEFNQNVLHFGIDHRILGDTDGVGVISKYGNRLIELDLNIFQSLLHPKNLSTTICCRDIFNEPHHWVTIWTLIHLLA